MPPRPTHDLQAVANKTGVKQMSDSVNTIFHSAACPS